MEYLYGIHVWITSMDYWYGLLVWITVMEYLYGIHVWITSMGYLYGNYVRKLSQIPPCISLCGKNLHKCVFGWFKSNVEG